MSDSPGAFRCHLEQPVQRTLPCGGIVCRGWAFGRDGRGAAGVRLEIGELVFEAGASEPRPDVRAAFPEVSDDRTGWEVRGFLPAGTHELVFSFRDSAGEWHRTLAHPVVGKPSRWPAWLPGRDAARLLAFQFPAHAVHAPRALEPERFPAPKLATSELSRLAIVTANLNQGWALPACLDSVLGATDLPLDYVVQDGGSTDGSLAILERYGPRLHRWSSGADRGQADAIARGFAQTTGRPEDLMAWINADDFYLPGALRFVAEYFARHPEVDVVYGNRVVVDRTGRELARWFLPGHDAAVLRLNDFIPQETMFWRRRLWDRVGGLDTALQFAMDWDLLLRFEAAGAVFAHLPRFLGAFRVHPQQKTAAQISSVGQAEIDRLRARTFGRRIVPEELLRDAALRRFLRRSAWREFLWRRGSPGRRA